MSFLLLFLPPSDMLRFLVDPSKNMDVDMYDDELVGGETDKKSLPRNSLVNIRHPH